MRFTFAAMKAAVLHALGTVPAYEETAEPRVTNGDETLLQVAAVAIKNLDKARAAGTHYSNYSQFPAVMGMDAVGRLENGQLVFAPEPVGGTLSEKAIVKTRSLLPLPENISVAQSAALPNAVIGAALPLKFRAGIKTGDTVVVNGATGVTGSLAVQLAKHYGAQTVIATGRNEAVLATLRDKGADFTVDMKAAPEHILAQLQEIQQAHPIDHIIDYLWGEPLDRVVSALPKGGVGTFTRPVKVVTVGEMAGAAIHLPSGLLRSSDIQFLGSGYGSISAQHVAEYQQEILPEMFRLLAEGKISIAVETHPISTVSEMWNTRLKGGKRLVFTVG